MNRDFFTVTTDPASEPITAADVKEFSRIDTSVEDTLIGSFITAIRQATELYLGRSLITQSLEYYLDYWPEDGRIIVPRPPLISVSSIVSIDEDGSEETLSSDNYYVISEAIPGEIVLKDTLTSFVINPRNRAGYKVSYSAGYGASSTDVPFAIRQGMMQWVAYVYETRNFQPEPPPEAKGFLSLFKVHNV